jgi:hypothetical protein
VDNSRLLDALGRATSPRSTPTEQRKAVAEASARLRALDNTLRPGRAAAPPGRNTPDPRQQVRAILQTDEFRRAMSDVAPRESWLERQWNRMWAAIERWWRGLFGNRRWSGPNLRLNWLRDTVLFLWNIRWWLLGAFLAVVLWLLLRKRGDELAGLFRRRRRQRSGGAHGGDLALDDDTPDPLGAARERAAAGDYRGAVRLAYIASLRKLQNAGLLVLERDKTNWEYQRALRGRSRAAHDTLLPATRLFDRSGTANRRRAKASTGAPLKSRRPARQRD